MESEATLRREGVTEARLAIASRYLGPEQGQRFAQARGPGFVLGLSLEHARSWDLASILP